MPDHLVADYDRGRRLDRDAILDVECDIWIPAARPDVVREDNVDRLKARLVRAHALRPRPPHTGRGASAPLIGSACRPSL